VDLKTNRVSILPGSRGMISPRWSPDGRYIAGVAASGNGLLLYDMRTRKQTELQSYGSGPPRTQILNQPGGCPSWSADSKFLFFSNAAGWWRMRISDRKADLVNSSKDLKNISLAGWGWFAVAPNNSLITARMIGTEEFYALDLDLP